MVARVIADITPLGVQSEDKDRKLSQAQARKFDPKSSDAFWRTLVANVVIKYGIASMPAPPEFANMFEILMCESEDDSHTTASRDLRQSQFDPKSQVPQPSQVALGFGPDLLRDQRIAAYLQPLMAALLKLQGRVSFVTETGRTGIASAGVSPRDLVTIALGSDMPLILRREEERYSMRFVREAYVHGIMDGEFEEIVRKMVLLITCPQYIFNKLQCQFLLHKSTPTRGRAV